MIERSYFKDTKNAYQTLSTTIQASKEKVFFYLATTEGISTWFPQLSITKENEKAFVLFDMGDETFEKMSLIDYKTEAYIAFEWAAGKVEFQLEEENGATHLLLKESLPLSFSAIPQDFTGWYVQMNQIKHVSETNSVGALDSKKIKQIREEVSEQLLAN